MEQAQNGPLGMTVESIASQPEATYFNGNALCRPDCYPHDSTGREAMIFGTRRHARLLALV